MTVLVTGGAGFIGSQFVDYYLNAHPERNVVCIDKLTYAGRMSNLESALQCSRFRFVRADICDRETVYKVFDDEKPDIAVNFAAESHVDRSIESPDVFLRSNVIGTSVLLDACVKYGIKRFHQISTDEVYGALPLNRPELLFTEETPLAPSSPYSASKASADMLVMAYRTTYGLPVTISRCSNNYGERQHEEKFIPQMISRAARDEALPVYGNGLNVRDWVYVLDHCKAVDLIIEKGGDGEIYNIGGRCEMRNIDIAKMILRFMDKPEELIRYVPDRKGHDLRYGMDISKINNELGWAPETDFKEWLERFLTY
ncbi:MAG: dTDP-glucose 4,6-dehydratase [Oscillospiraceae bacterium]|nr:dTDP-glucose 4,6-dehydratase [Oscillospiraceae bacterium]